MITHHRCDRCHRETVFCANIEIRNGLYLYAYKVCQGCLPSIMAAIDAALMEHETRAIVLDGRVPAKALIEEVRPSAWERFRRAFAAWVDDI